MTKIECMTSEIAAAERTLDLLTRRYNAHNGRAGYDFKAALSGIDAAVVHIEKLYCMLDAAHKRADGPKAVAAHNAAYDGMGLVAA